MIFCLAISKTVGQDNQTIQQTEQTPNWPVMLSNLNTAQITSGVLIDKVTTFSALTQFSVSSLLSSSNQR
jgi:hypothetical protein